MCEHVTVSGIMAFDPNLFEDGMNVDAETHHMVDYEISVEMFLAQRRRWLWRKALTHAWICAALICQSRRHIALQDKLRLPRTETQDKSVIDGESWADGQSTAVKEEWAKQKLIEWKEAEWGHTINPEKLKKWKKYAKREVERAGASGEAVDVFLQRKTLPRTLTDPTDPTLIL